MQQQPLPFQNQRPRDLRASAETHAIVAKIQLSRCVDVRECAFRPCQTLKLNPHLKHLVSIARFLLLWHKRVNYSDRGAAVNATEINGEVSSRVEPSGCRVWNVQPEA